MGDRNSGSFASTMKWIFDTCYYPWMSLNLPNSLPILAVTFLAVAGLSHALLSGESYTR